MTQHPQRLVIRGATGDLTKRMLLPGLGMLLASDADRRVEVWGVGREPLEPAAWGAKVGNALVRGGCDDDQALAVVSASRYLQVDVAEREGMEALLAALPDRDTTVLYFAVPPSITRRACEHLARCGDLGELRLALEKPFGDSLAAARDFNALLATFRSERQVFRVDHFLGDSQVLNLLALRFANRLFEPVWSAAHVASIEITANETLALEGRAGYYDTAGALVDMIQSHLLLVLALVTMEEPARLEPRVVHDLMAHALSVTQVAGGDPVRSSRRARYAAGTSRDREVPAYRDEDGVDPDRRTETLVELDLEIANRRWSGVPIRLRSGKALAADARGVRITLRPVEFAPHGMGGYPPANVFTIHLNPDEITVEIVTNQGGGRFRLGTAQLEAAVGETSLAPYAEVLAAVLDDNRLISVRGDLAEECWRICEPVLEAWRSGAVPLDEYPAGSTGPAHWSGPLLQR